MDETPYTTEVLITPEMAAALLKKNSINRPLRTKRAEFYAQQMRDGSWTISESAICVSPDGRLLNGQHRLKACILAGIPFRSIVRYNVPLSEYQNMDAGMPRTDGDALGIDDRLAQLAKYMLTLAFDTNSAFPRELIREMAEIISPEYNDLVRANKSLTKILSSVPVRAAVILQIYGNELRHPDSRQVLLNSYALLVGSRGGLPSSLGKLLQWVTKHPKISGGTDRLELFAQALSAFNYVDIAADVSRQRAISTEAAKSLAVRIIRDVVHDRIKSKARDPRTTKPSLLAKELRV